MLKPNLVAAISCATFSLVISQSVAAGALTQEEFNKMAEEAGEQKLEPAAVPAPERPVMRQTEAAANVKQGGRDDPSAPVAAAPPSVQPVQPPAPDRAPLATGSPAQQRMPMERGRAFYEKRIRDLSERAGTDMPGRPSWAGRGMGMGRQLMTDEERTAHREAMRSMSPEERKAYRTQMHEQMRERAWEEGVVLPETPPWESATAQMQPPPPPSTPSWADRMADYRDRVSRMSPEDRRACQALSRMEMREHMGRMMREMASRMMQYRSDFAQRQYPQGGYGQDYQYLPEEGYPMAPGPGYGTGYPSRWGGGPGAGPMAPGEDFGPGYPSGPGYGTGYGSPWGYGR